MQGSKRLCDEATDSEYHLETKNITIAASCAVLLCSRHALLSLKNVVIGTIIVLLISDDISVLHLNCAQEATHHQGSVTAHWLNSSFHYVQYSVLNTTQDNYLVIG